MAALTSLLPQPKHQLIHHQEVVVAPQLAVKRVVIPPYGQRQGFIPRSVEDYGDGGAFPEIHVAQFPLDMGRKKDNPSTVVPITLDAEGKIKYDAIITRETKNTVYSRATDLVGVEIDEELLRPSPEVEQETTEKTRAALEKIVNGKIKASRPAAPAEQKNAPTYIRYTPSKQGEAYNSGANSRIIKMVEMPKDPLEPPKFKHKKVPRGPPSPPVPVMHSPPRKVTSKEQQDWKIPPCISNWKNPKGYTIPLDKRLAADGRGLLQVQINDNFAKFSESLYIAERNAREAVSTRVLLREKLARTEKERREEELRKLAQQTREKRAGLAVNPVETDTNESMEDMVAREEREKIRDDRKRDRVRDRRLEALGKKKSKTQRDADRDVSEKIALGQMPAAASSETMYDQRLFNQSQGLDSGFGSEESYNIYDKPFHKGTSASMLYRPKKSEDEEVYGGEEGEMNKLLNTTRFKPDRDFQGVDRSKATDARDRPVEFEKDKEEEDPFGLNDFINKAKSGKKR